MVLVPFVKIDGFASEIFVGYGPDNQIPDWTPDTGKSLIPGLEVPGTISQSLSPYESIANIGNLQLVVDDLPEAGALGPYTFSRTFGAPARQAPSAQASESIIRRRTSWTVASSSCE